MSKGRRKNNGSGVPASASGSNGSDRGGNGPVIALLLLVVSAIILLGWWAFWSPSWKGAPPRGAAIPTPTASPTAL